MTARKKIYRKKKEGERGRARKRTSKAKYMLDVSLVNNVLMVIAVRMGKEVEHKKMSTYYFFPRGMSE
jgi:hypothetical protein